MSDTIQVDYERLRQIAKRFAETESQIETLSRHLESHIENLRNGAWVGEGANAFYAEMDNLLLPSLLRTTKAMQASQETIDIIIREFEAAEEDASNRLGREMDDDGEGAFPRSNDPNTIEDGTHTGKVAMKDADIIYVNGIQTKPQDHLDTLKVIEGEFEGKNVAGVYNKSKGLLDIGTDVKEALGDRYGSGDNIAVASLKDAIKTRLAEGGTFEVFAHSQGAAITAEALRQLKAENVNLSSIKVTTMGGFGINYPDGVDVHHYVHPNDPVGMLSVIEDPNVRQKTTVMHNIESPIASQIPIYKHLSDHSGGDYIRNIEEFRELESRGGGKIQEGSFVDNMSDAVSITRNVVDGVNSIADMIF